MTDFFLNEFFHGTHSTIYKSEVKAVENGYEVYALLPGFRKDEIDVKLNGDDLIIHAKTERKIPGFLNNHVKKTFGVNGLDTDSLTARLEDGLLIISMKKEAAKNDRKINVL